MGNQKTFRLEAGKGKVVPVHTTKTSEQWNYNSIHSKLRRQLGRSSLFHAPLLYPPIYTEQKSR
jgi:hypothetical protein